MSGARLARRSRRRPRAASAAASPAGPTPETVAKLRRDLLEYLFARGRLRREHLDAGEEIRRIWEALSRGLVPSASDPSALVLPPRPSRPLFQPIDLLTVGEEAIWRRRYRPWAAETSRISGGGTVGVSRFRIVVDLAVDNRSLRQVEAWYRLRHGAAFEHLRAGLQRYAEIAGWIEPSAPVMPAQKFSLNDKKYGQKLDRGQNS